jgi:hypothetical protein
VREPSILLCQSELSRRHKSGNGFQRKPHALASQVLAICIGGLPIEPTIGKSAKYGIKNAQKLKRSASKR